MPFFSFEYFENKTVLGLIENNWIWFFDYFNDKQFKVSTPKDGLNILFSFYSENQDLTQYFNVIPDIDYTNLINNLPEKGYLFFDENTNVFKFKNETTERLATHEESF